MVRGRPPTLHDNSTPLLQADDNGSGTVADGARVSTPIISNAQQIIVMATTHEQWSNEEMSNGRLGVIDAGVMDGDVAATATPTWAQVLQVLQVQEARLPIELPGNTTAAVVSPVSDVSDVPKSDADNMRAHARAHFASIAASCKGVQSQTSQNEYPSTRVVRVREQLWGGYVDAMSVGAYDAHHHQLIAYARLESRNVASISNPPSTA
jgi:hypothetical protein